MQNLTNPGDRYDKLVVLYKIPKTQRYLCMCDCGNTKIATGQALRTYAHQSCGCELNSWRRLPDGESSFRALYENYKRHSKRRKLEWSVSAERFRALVTSNCFYCGSRPHQVSKAHKRSSGEFVYTGIDRVDSSIGYIDGNVEPCCKACNFAKSTMSQSEFADWIGKVYHNFAVSRLTTGEPGCMFKV